MEEIKQVGEALGNHWIFIVIGIVATRFSPIIFSIWNGKVKADKDLKETLESHLKRLKEEDEEQARQILELEKENARKEAKLQILTELLTGKLPDLDTIFDQLHEKIDDRSDSSNEDDDLSADLSQDIQIKSENNFVSEQTHSVFTNE